MIRSLFLIGILTLIIACSNKGETQGEKQNAVKKSAVVKSVEENPANESHYIVPDSILTSFKSDVHPTNQKKFYYTEIEINGELRKIAHDFMDIDRLLINGGFSQYSIYDSLISIIGKPESTKRIEEIEYQYSIYKYKGMKMTMHDFDSLVYCDMIDFKVSDSFIKYDSLRIDSKTTLSDFVKLYPLSCSNVEKDRLFNNEINCDWVRLEPKGDYLRDDEHIFLFEDGFLRFYLYFNGDD